MFQLDDSFLQSLGLGALPDDQKAPLLQHIREELEQRVGTKLADGLSDAQLAEFEGIIERDEVKVNEWLAVNVATYRTERDYLDLAATAAAQKGGALDENDVPTLNAEYAATKWLELNRSDYKRVVAATLEELRNEITSNRDSFLA